ncbi:MAG: hypothetical protein NC089_03575 [Bacteroides sp.]|nr:hypothetical protein [Bacteroides sp.]MCM1549752.1 hypothetical protein [Clostridium sp.]
MSDKNANNLYDDGNIPDIDLPKQKTSQGDQTDKSSNSVEPLPESTRPRKDGPGGA